MKRPRTFTTGKERNSANRKTKSTMYYYIAQTTTSHNHSTFSTAHNVQIVSGPFLTYREAQDACDKMHNETGITDIAVVQR